METDYTVKLHHKLITKVYSNRLIKAVGNKINPHQTAYINGRQITDNNTVAHLATLIKDGMIISLDAAKAFDSVAHKFIERVLAAFNLSKFLKIFNTFTISRALKLSSTIGSPSHIVLAEG